MAAFQMRKNSASALKSINNLAPGCLPWDGIVAANVCTDVTIVISGEKFWFDQSKMYFKNTSVYWN